MISYERNTQLKSNLEKIRTLTNINSSFFGLVIGLFKFNKKLKSHIIKITIF